jgi:protein XagA
MFRSLYALAACLLLFLSYASDAQAGAWTLPAGSAEVTLNAVQFQSNAYWDRLGNKISQPRFSKTELNPYVEYGLEDGLTIGASLFLHRLSQDATGNQHSTNYGLGNSEFFARQQLLQSEDGAVLSVQPIIALPALYNHRNNAPRAGNDGMEAELSVLGGAPFILFGATHYAELGAGYRHRFAGGLHGQVKLHTKAGFRLLPDLELIPALYQTIATSKDASRPFREDGQADYDLLKGELLLRYAVDDARFVQAGAAAHLRGRNVGDGRAVILSVGQQF